MSCFRIRPLLLASAVLVLMPALAARAQGPATHCRIVCAPTLHFRPTVVRSHLGSHPRVRSLTDGTTHRLPSKTNLMLDLHAIVPTALPRTSLYAAFNWFPNADRSVNPYTEYSASELNDAGIRANSPAISYGVAVVLLERAQTHGWVGLDWYGGGVFSAAARPNDGSTYTHKLDLGGVASLGVFSWTSPATWLHHASAFTVVDWIASGLPKAGDEVPDGERVFLDDVHGVSLQFGLILPVVPSR